MHEVKDTQQQVVRHYTYHPSGLLNEATYPGGGTISNVWDATGTRLGITINEAYYTFVYDVTAGIPAVIEEDDGTTTICYYREPGGALIARRIGEEGWRYYHFDELGSTRAITDIYGDVVDTYEYDAWGNLTNWQCLDLQPYMYVGQLGYYTHYQTADLYGQPKFQPMQLGVRFYDPEIGRFTQRDPVQDGLNWYAYVEGNPLAYVDAWGLEPLPKGLNWYVKRAIMQIKTTPGYEDIGAVLWRYWKKGGIEFLPDEPGIGLSDGKIYLCKMFSTNLLHTNTYDYNITNIASTLVHEYYHSYMQDNYWFMYTFTGLVGALDPHVSTMWYIEQPAYNFQANYIQSLYGVTSPSNQEQVMLYYNNWKNNLMDVYPEAPFHFVLPSQLEGSLPYLYRGW